MKKLILAGIAMMTVAISSCDEDTTTLGNTLTSTIDQFTIVSDTFNVTTRSIIADSVLSRSAYSYLGRIKDPETGSYISGDYMTQFALLENEASYIFAPQDSILSRDADNLPIADSCAINVIVSEYMGDSLAAMKLTLTELGTPLRENQSYYTNFDLAANGYLREGGIRKNKMFAISDLQLSDSARNVRRSGSYYDYINIPLNEPYTDLQGNTYNNYGTYLLRNYYNHPEYFKNSLEFTQHVCPGFYLQTTDGLGLMTEIERTQLVVYYHYRIDTLTYSDAKAFNGTEEVLQTTHFTNDRETIERLAANETFTYLKAPDGIFTEVTLPVDDIKLNHENDTIVSAKVVFRRMNDQSELSDDILEEPQNLLMIERDSLYSFFENRNLPDNVTSYLATYSSSKNTYTFNNISGLINRMYNSPERTENWNKVVLVPVQVTSTTSSSGSSSVASINNELKITSVRLAGGKQNQHDPVRISIIYNKTH